RPVANAGRPPVTGPTLDRDSPWGPLRVADAHVHFFSHRFLTTVAGQKPGLTMEDTGAKLGWALPPEKPEQLAEIWAAELDRHGVQAAALIASIPGDEASVTAAAKAFPSRFYAFAMVNPKAFYPEALSTVQTACLFPAM